MVATLLEPAERRRPVEQKLLLTAFWVGEYRTGGGGPRGPCGG